METIIIECLLQYNIFTTFLYRTVDQYRLLGNLFKYAPFDITSVVIYYKMRFQSIYGWHIKELFKYLLSKAGLTVNIK